jgi:hypothetical protein
MIKAWIEPFYDLENQVCAAYRCAPLAWAAGSHYSTILAACLIRDPGNSQPLLRQELECAIETCTQLAGWKSASSDLPDARIHSPAAIIVASEHRSTVRRNTGWKPMLCYINAVAASLQMHGDNGRHENKHCGIHPDELCETHPGRSRGTRCDRRRDIRSGSSRVFMERL